MKTFLATIALLLVPATAYAQGAQDEIPVDRVVAVVGSEPILWSDILEFVNQRRAQGLQMPTDPEGQRALVTQAINELVDEELLVQQAKTLQIEVTDSEVAAGVEQQVRRVRAQMPSEEVFRAELEKAGFGTPEEYRRTMLGEARRAALQQRVIDKLRQDGRLVPAPVSEADVTAAFEKNRESLPVRPASIAFRQVIVAPQASPEARAAARAKADSLLAELRAGGDFEQVARRESMDPGSRELGGDLGWNRRGKMVPEFERVMFALPPGQLSPVVETQYGYHIIRVDRVQPAEVKARHILIRPAIDSADVERARIRADSVAALWRTGTPFDTLVARYHDRDEETVIPEIERERLPADTYGAAFAGKSEGDIVDPFRIPDARTGAVKFVVAQIDDVTEGGQYTLSELRQTIRQQLAQERAIRRLLDSLRKETHVAIRDDLFETGDAF